jgi:glycerol kinase
VPTTTSFYGVSVGEQNGGAVSSTEVLEVFDILRPRACTTPLIRIGGDHDGAYLVPDDLSGIAACYWPAVNRGAIEGSSKTLDVVRSGSEPAPL